ncbi:ATPase [Clostridium sp. A1-XYC3]|uniref:ATPase n=1 Tax=Clostridium tanneri TaxID=3037988 RepID=A0ABU4JSW9_9CLOT|nr:ATPase [Clostridium sp. A1-XYC3]MDW8801066.1 ATPase [Clostridium sp. A1-XYC3]
MDAIKLLEYLREILDTSAKVPMTAKVVVDKKEVMEIVHKILKSLPDELKKAQWVVEEKERILSEAIQEAENLKKESLSLLKKQIENHDITKEANMRSEEIISSAQRSAKDIRLGARDYASEILNQLDRELTDKSKQMLLSLKNDMQGFLADLESDINIRTDLIRKNIKELRDMK